MHHAFAFRPTVSDDQGGRKAKAWRIKFGLSVQYRTVRATDLEHDVRFWTNEIFSRDFVFKKGEEKGAFGFLFHQLKNRQTDRQTEKGSVMVCDVTARVLDAHTRGARSNITEEALTTCERVELSR